MSLAASGSSPSSAITRGAIRADDGLAHALAAIVGERRVLERPGELRAYESDGLPGYQQRLSLVHI